VKLATKKRRAGTSEPSPGKAPRARPGAKTTKTAADRPKIRAHVERPNGRPRSAGPARGGLDRPSARRVPRRVVEPDAGVDRAALVTSGGIGDLVPKQRAHGTVRKAPLTGPRRALPRRSGPPEAGEPSSATRELALEIAAAGIDKKAVGIEILDVCGKVDYADFLVIMTGRSDRHVHAIATGLEEALRVNKKVAPLSMEGLTAASWVLIDFGDVVVHVFQEEARRLYDIEGLWIDANRVPVPDEGPSATTSPSADLS